MMDRWWGDVQREGYEMAEIILALRPEKDDIVTRKSTYSAFARSDLDRQLRERSVEQVVTIGVLTHLCCDTISRVAFARDLEVYFTIDGTAWYNDEFHTGTLRALADGLTIPVTCGEVLKCLGR